ncbi:hypothetical protein NEUTE1DRAFT_122089 [Neurospora tetrasperma FGSC 2508]|uniref:Uncharacterized protein n=1 Tax=Neurospora tetrasperma (strain FGSC 2508 / ATCC MYA-4615 / P0657) TaxID=510951 RepID=F8MM37_NEUT8|nr:uncharacterized protein NEUTE1DRAFT_122089 [Neurospora tetrasperma FGSC 2508]EGO57711.1 hypothetical protein NEUTE1DRAFT_122089 [Neurospora tetrasperma FGSC 2508]
MDYSSSTPQRRTWNSPQRKEQQQQQRQQTGVAHEQAQPWTATRCNRLLRPLLAHIGALKKEKERKLGVSESVGQGKSTSSATFGKRQGRGGSKPATYSSKTSSRAHLTTPEKPRRQRVGRRPVQETAVPTPYLRHTTDNYLASSPAQPILFAPTKSSSTSDHGRGARCSHRSCQGVQCRLEACLAQLRLSTDQETYSIYESVFRTLDALLRATSPPKSPASASPKSFLAMCLRRIPDYINELEYWEKKDAEANKTKSVMQESRASFDIYSELESLGALGGWKHLRIVVRAHGVKIIQGAIRDGLLDDRIAILLISLCYQYLPLVECLDLTNAFVSRQYPSPDRYVRNGLTIEAPALLPLAAIGYGHARTKRFMLGKLADLFANGSLPAEWLLVSAFKTARLDAMAKLFYGTGQDCVDFLITMIDVLSPLMSERRQTCSCSDLAPHKLATGNLTGDMATLVSQVLRHFDDPKKGERAVTPSQLAVFAHRVRYIFRTYLLHARKTSLPSPAVYLISLCDFLAFGTESSASTIASAAWKGAKSGQRIDRLDQQYSMTLGVLGTIVINYSRSNGSTSAHTYIPQICDKMRALQIPDNLPYHPFENIELDVAFFVAFETNDLQDLAYAEKLWAKKKSTTCPHAMMKAKPYYEERIRTREESEGKSFTGFKWDDALSEWVTVDLPQPAVGGGGGRTTRRSTRCPSLMEAIQRYTPTATSSSTSTLAPNQKQTRGSTRLVQSRTASLATSTTVDTTNDDTDADNDDDLQDDDASSETTTTTPQTATVDSSSDWSSDFETSNVVGPNETYQQIPPPPPPPPRRRRLQLQPQPQQRRLSGNKRKSSHLDTDNEVDQENDSDEDDDDDDDDDFSAPEPPSSGTEHRRPLAKQPRTRASLVALAIATTNTGAGAGATAKLSNGAGGSASANASASRSGNGTSSNGGNTARRRSLRRSAGSSGSGRAIYGGETEETSEDELG